MPNNLVVTNDQKAQEWSASSLPFPTLLYQSLNVVLDWRSALNAAIGRRVPKVAAIANPRSIQDVRNLGYEDASQLPKFLKWNRGWLAKESFLGDVYLEMFMIGSVATDIMPLAENRLNIAKAKEQLEVTIRHAVSHGFDVIALTASTKRLFSAKELRERFPGVFFTLGDNLTALTLWKTILRVIGVKSLSASSRVLVIGPSGFLGESTIERLKMNAYGVVGLGTNKIRAERIADKYGIQVALSPEEIEGPIDMIVACNHGIPITREFLERFYVGKEIPVVDVCEPAAFTKEEVLRCSDMACRFDADVYSDYFSFVLGRLAEMNMALGEKMTYPCFAEGAREAFIASLREHDFLSVSLAKQELLESCFSERMFVLPERPMSFGRPAG